MRFRWPFVSAALMLSGCGGGPPPPFGPLAEEFTQSTLAFSPVAATQAGYHSHQGVPLDEQLDDFSPESLDRQRRFYREFRERLRKIDRARLDPEDRADADMVADQIEMSLLELDTIQNWRHNPTVYVELIGNGLFSAFVLEYAPKAERFRRLIARIEKIPALLDQARKNLASAPEIWNTVAREENQGNIGLIDKTLRDQAPPELKASYQAAAAKALAALRSFEEWLATDLAKRVSDWRVGQRYDAKFRYVLATGQQPGELLSRAESELQRVRLDMYRLAGGVAAGSPEPAEINRVVSAKLAQIARRHATPGTYFAHARRDLEQARQFVRARNLLQLPARDNLQVIETPEFMRGIYAVGGFNPAPPLEPHLGAFYWLTPIDSGAPARAESKLREYNDYGLQLLTIHEAMPGHYVQFEYANAIEPTSRRLLRALFGNGPYVEGWAVYITEVMLEAGYLDGSPDLRLTFQKQQLRMIANTILDVRLQTLGMTDEQAMDLMIRDTFQEKEEATAKLRRAKLSSCQLPTYYAGWLAWRDLAERRRAALGAEFNLAAFHERALKTGAVPLPVLDRLLR